MAHGKDTACVGAAGEPARERLWVRNVTSDPEAVQGQGSTSFLLGFSWFIPTGKSERCHDYFPFLSRKLLLRCGFFSLSGPLRLMRAKHWSRKTGVKVMPVEQDGLFLLCDTL